MVSLINKNGYFNPDIDLLGKCILYYRFKFIQGIDYFNTNYERGLPQSRYWFLRTGKTLFIQSKCWLLQSRIIQTRIKN